MANIINMNLVGEKQCKKVLADNPTYKVFWRSGFAYRGARECEISKEPQEELCYPYYDSNGKWHNKKVMTFEKKMQRKYDWAAAIDIKIDHDAKELHFNGFSENDMYL